MAKMRSSHLVIGVAVVVMGYALMIIAMARQAERVAASATPAPTCAPVDTVARVIDRSRHHAAREHQHERALRERNGRRLRERWVFRGSGRKR